MKYINQFSLSVDAKSINEGFVRSAVAAFCVQLNPTIEEIGDIKTAVSEAVTNSIVHGYKGKDGQIVVTVGLCEDGKTIEISVQDFGVGIPDVEQAMQTFFTTSPTDERSGMGFTVMEAFTDDLLVTSEVNKGTLVKMKKLLGANGNEIDNEQL